MTNPSSSLSGKVALVTGGSRGYGFGIAKRLHEAGAKVWITGRHADALEKATAAIGAGAQSVVADVTRSEDWDRVFEEILSQGQRLDVLVNNAGGAVKVAAMAQQTDRDIIESIAINLTGPMLGIARAARIMQKQQDGIIINISSVCAIHAWPDWTPYSAAKAGLNQMSKGLFTELRCQGIRVTTVIPSWGATGFVQAASIDGHPAANKQIESQLMHPDELGDLVVTICLQPKHLVLPTVAVQPMIQDIVPM